MTTDETSVIKQHFYDEHLPRLKPIGEHEIIDKQPLQKQPKLRGSSFFPPIASSVISGSAMTNNSIESPPSSAIYSSTVREAAQRFMLQNKLTLSSGSSPSRLAHNIPPKKSSLYDHVQPRIDTGLPRIESMARNESYFHRLKPIHPLSWSLIKQELEQDIQIRAQTKRMQFNSGVTYTTQLTTLGNLVRSKVKNHISSVMGYGEERYKIVVHLTVFETIAAGLHVASRCLWNINTDNSITIKMQGVDCDILIVVFLCYTDLGAI